MIPDPRRLIRFVDRFSEKRLLIVGDFMLDHFVRGRVERISPEAPVPVVQVTQETFVPGGAGNVAANLRALSAQVCILGVVGDDEAGASLREDLRARGVRTDHLLRDPSRPTTVKVRVIAEHQQVVRYDREKKGPLPRDLRDRALEALEE
jgi:rfaE bifunctional protein kinase chain/domain